VPWVTQTRLGDSETLGLGLGMPARGPPQHKLLRAAWDTRTWYLGWPGVPTADGAQLHTLRVGMVAGEIPARSI
jgi:hypothetical protein